MLVDGEELHLTKVLCWPRRWREDIRRRPVDQFWPGLSVTAEAVVVEISLEFGNAMTRGVDPSQAGSVIAVPELEMLVGLGTTGAGRETLGLRVAVLVEGITIDVLVPVDG
jgi:hypothetical protein